MRLTLLALLLNLFTMNSFAKATGLFSSTGSSVKIIVQGDQDGLRLFDSLTAEAVEENGILKKSITVESSMFDTIYEITCNKSIQVQALASCTIGLDGNYGWTRIDEENKTASVVPYGDLDNYASYSEFIAPDENDVIFLSSDNTLKISVERNSLGDIYRFRMEYKQ